MSVCTSAGLFCRGWAQIQQLEFMQPATIKFKVESRFPDSVPSLFDGVLGGGEINPMSQFVEDSERL
jgi:hypothetical protein